jgi:hypothetical protein
MSSLRTTVLYYAAATAAVFSLPRRYWHACLQPHTILLSQAGEASPDKVIAVRLAARRFHGGRGLHGGRGFRGGGMMAARRRRLAWRRLARQPLAWRLARQPLAWRLESPPLVRTWLGFCRSALGLWRILRRRSLRLWIPLELPLGLRPGLPLGLLSNPSCAPHFPSPRPLTGRRCPEAVRRLTARRQEALTRLRKE